MKTGKISDSILKRSVLKRCRTKHPDVMQGAGSGNDCAVVNVQNKSMISCSVHPEIVEDNIMICYAVEHALNNLACSGSVPMTVLLTLLLPEQAQEGTLREMMDGAENVCRRHGVQIAGGHTQVTDAVISPVLGVTAVGSGGQEILTGKKNLADAEIVMTGYAGLEGTVLLARRKSEELCGRFPIDFVEQTKKYAGSISVLHEAEIAWKSGAGMLHDVAQGGIFGALWELCEKAKCGMEVNLRLIPIKQETVEICEHFGLNPYCLRSGGSLLIVTRQGEGLVQELGRKNIPACVIGRLTDSNDRIFLNGEEKRYLDRPAQDEYYRWKDAKNGKA
ncbi:MAG: AIR synthase related protein [Eubacteriales bacterium]|nr:AIR synthase related protein [Eubacteriales bacterium]